MGLPLNNHAPFLKLVWCCISSYKHHVLLLDIELIHWLFKFLSVKEKLEDKHYYLWQGSPSIHFFICPFLHLFIHPLIHNPSVHLFLYLSIPPSIYPSIHPSINLFRSLEGIVRSLNNLLERFHHSEFFYVTTSPFTFLSIGQYSPFFALLLAPLAIEVRNTIIILV